MVLSVFPRRAGELRTTRLQTRGGWLFRLFMAWFARDDLDLRA